MKSHSLAAYPRTFARRQQVKKLRASGRVPAVIYGRQIQPQNLEVAAKDLENLVHHSISENMLVDLAVDGDARPKRLAMVREIQHHPLSGKMLHVDFHEISENEKVTAMVPVESVGEAAGVKAGGTLEHVLFKLKVRALPKDLPDELRVDVSHLEIGRGIHVGDIKPPPGVEILGDAHISVLAVAAPVTEEQEAAAAAAATEPLAETEMIKEKREDEEGEAAPAGKAAAGGKAAPAAKAGDKAVEKAPAAEKGAEKKAEKKK
jgi:large subunit ribosomal protein L25